MKNISHAFLIYDLYCCLYFLKQKQEPSDVKKKASIFPHPPLRVLLDLKDKKLVPQANVKYRWGFKMPASSPPDVVTIK
jgi:hypothetical protein